MQYRVIAEIDLFPNKFHDPRIKPLIIEQTIMVKHIDDYY